MVSLIIFDLDGTLVDSKKDIADSLNLSLSACGFSTLSQEKIEDLVGRGARQLVKEAIGDPSDEVLWRVFQRFCQTYDEHLLDFTRLYPGVREFLESHSELPMAVVTNKPQHFSKKILEGLKIDHHFRWLIAGDTLTVQKPDPQVLQPILQETGPFEQALIVGDSDVDIFLGKAAGLLTCAVSYGFRPRKELELLQPDFLIDRFTELSQLPLFTSGAAQEAS